MQYISIPHYPQTTVEGHPELVLGTLHDIDILIAKEDFIIMKDIHLRK